MRNPILCLMRDSEGWSIDRWEMATETHFIIADAMWHAGISIPSAWGYHHGLCLNGPSDGTLELLGMLDRWEIEEDDLTHAGNVLSRYCALLKSAGLDY